MKHELIDGEIVAMAGGTPDHGGLAMSLGRHLAGSSDPRMLMKASRAPERPSAYLGGMRDETIRGMRRGSLAAAWALLFCACGVSGADGADPGERTETVSSAITSPSPSMGPYQTGLGIVRPVVAVGQDYVLTANAGNQFNYYRRNASDPSGTPIDWPTIPVDGNLGAIPSGPNTVHGALSTIFQGVITPIDNDLPVAPAGTPAASVVPACPVTSGLGDASSAADLGCLSALYDGDVYYDRMSGHFFIMMKARRSIWPCTPTTPGFTAGWTNGATGAACNPASADYVAALAPRYIMVAVSQCNPQGLDCENPANGWNTYVLANQYRDWSQIMVTRGLVMVDYHGGESPDTYLDAPAELWVYGAQSLIDGTLPQYLPTPLYTFTVDDFSKPLPGSSTANPLPSSLMFVKQPNPAPTDFPLLFSYSSNPAELWLYNLYPTEIPSGMDLSAPSLNLQISPPLRIALPTSNPPNQELYVPAAYDNGVFYWATSAPRPGDSTNTFVETWQVPVQSVAAPNASGQAPTGSGGYEVDLGLPETGTSYGYPVLDVVPSIFSTGGNVMTAFHTWTGGSMSYQISASYAVLPAGSGQYEGPFLISGPTGAAVQPPGAAGDPDILSVAADPVYPDQFFMTSITDTGSTSWITAGFTAPFSTTSSCNGTNTLYPDVNDSPLQVAQGSDSELFVLMCGPWVAVDWGNGAAGTVLGTSLTGASTIQLSTGVTIDSEGALNLLVGVPLTETPGLYYVDVQAEDLQSKVKLSARIPVDVLACQPPPQSTCEPDMCGVWNASECGGVECGSCSAGDVCSSGRCCATGSFFNGTVCQPDTCPTGTTWCSNKNECLAQCSPTCPPSTPLCPVTNSCLAPAACGRGVGGGGGGGCKGTTCM